VHPLSIAAFRLTAVSRLRSGDPAAPENYRLPLLPSGSDGVHRFSPRRTQSSTPLSRRSPTMPDLEREFNPAVADCGYRAPLVPRLARPLILPDGTLYVKQIPFVSHKGAKAAKVFVGTQRRRGNGGTQRLLMGYGNQADSDANPQDYSLRNLCVSAPLRLCVQYIRP
jgi:hypothetical protein